MPMVPEFRCCYSTCIKFCGGSSRKSERLSPLTLHFITVVFRVQISSLADCFQKQRGVKHWPVPVSYHKSYANFSFYFVVKKTLAVS